MSGFQTAVQTYPSIGVPGDVASANAVIHKIPTPQADGDILVASFAFDDPAGDGTTVKPTALASNASIAGFVQRVLAQPMLTVTDEASQVIPDGYPVPAAIKGDFYCKSLTTATVGQKVFASLTDGTIKTGAHSATVSGYTETDFVVKVGAAIGEIVTISNW